MAVIGSDISKAKQLLEEGKLVAIPTETVYGLAGNAFNPDAILDIFRVKNRPAFDPLIAHTDSLVKIAQFVDEIPDEANALAAKFWPGPLTILLKKKSMVPDILTSGLPQVAVRIPAHELTYQLLSTLDFPLAAPSANPFGYVSPTEASHVEDKLGNKIEYILDGGSCTIGLESTIVGFEDGIPIIYRLGGTSIDEIEKVVGKVTVNINQSSNPKAPGMVKSHYAPTIPLALVDKLDFSQINEQTGIITFNSLFDIPGERIFTLSPTGSLEEAARNLFKALRFFEGTDIKQIIAEKVPPKGLGLAINDRLQRAAAPMD